MNKGILLLLGVFLVMACSEGKTKTTELAESTSEVETKKVIDTQADPTIPSYNYDALNETFLSKMDDVTYVVNFWATWCKPCIKELPAFEQLNTAYQDKNVKVILVSLDFPEKWNSAVIPFLEGRGIRSQAVLLDDPDANRWINAVSEDWSGAIPATVMVKNGEKTFFERSFTFKELENELKIIL